MTKLLTICTIASLMSASVINAENITVFDEDYSNSNSWYSTQEDNEVEPGMDAENIWDLEEFTLDGLNLGVVAEFDLKDGVNIGTAWRPDIYGLGDIFIDIHGDAQYGNLSHSALLDPDRVNFGYEYAIQLDFTDLSYDIYELTSESQLKDVNVAWNAPSSNPFELIVTDEEVVFSDNFIYNDFDATGKNSIEGINLASIIVDPSSPLFTSHVTMRCGNDNLMGHVPEPSAIGLLLLGGLSLLVVARRRTGRA